jgi:outer membrane protein insertion porin family
MPHEITGDSRRPGRRSAMKPRRTGSSRGLLPVALLVCGLLSAFLPAGPATADPPAPEEAASGESAADYKGWQISSFAVRGLEEGLASQLSKGLALAGRSRLWGTKRPPLYPSTLEQDLERTRLFLARRGYPYARVRPRFKPDPRSRHVGVILEVEPGPAVLVASVSWPGLPPSFEARAEKAVSLHAGVRFTEERLEQGIKALLNLLKTAGYAQAQIVPEISSIDSTQVKVTYEVEAGDVYHFAGVKVTGIGSDLAPLARKETGISPGQPYTPAAVRSAEENLRLLGLFRQIRLTTQVTGPGELDLNANLVERMQRTLEISTGYWTDEQFIARARWEHRNLLGAGRGLAVQAYYSVFDQNASLSFWWPGLLGALTRGIGRVFVEHQDEGSYELVNSELSLKAAYRRDSATTLQGGLAFSNVNVNILTEDVTAFQGRSGQLLILSAGWWHDSANDRLYPSAGGISNLNLEWSPPGAFSDSPYARFETTATLYRSLGDPVVLATRLDLGLAKPLGNAKDLLPNKRFYAGGATSMRGFKRRRLGPLDAAGDALGGEALLEASIELRYPILGRLFGAWFLDTGQVWSRPIEMNLGQLEVAVGPGLMVQTPVGYLRADVGHRLTRRQPDQPLTVFHLAIGQPF